MSSKAIVWIIIVIVVIGGVWWYIASRNSQNAMPGYGAASTSTYTAGTESTGTTSNPASAMSSGSSNADLNQNLTQIDGQMNAYASDSANVDQSMNGQ